MNFIQEIESYNIPYTNSYLDKLDQYADLLIEANKHINLTAITDKDDVYFKHFLDSLLLYPYLNDKKLIYDVGSGAGFPGLPLAIFYPTGHFVLIEPIKKRCNFLNEVIKTLDLSNVEVVNQRSEEYIKENKKADLVVSRAVARLNILSELCAPLVNKGGLFIPMKGPSYKEELEEAENALNILHLELINTDIHHIDDHTKVNLIFKKTRDNSSKYPRPYAQIKKKPL